MADAKTKPTRKSVQRFIAAIKDDRRRADAERVLAIMREVTGEEPVLWGSDLIGFGRYSYAYESGTTGEYFVTGFSPRKTNISLYMMAGFDTHADLLGKLGKHKTGRSCLYVNRLDDIDEKVLRRLIKANVAQVKRTWGRHG